MRAEVGLPRLGVERGSRPNTHPPHIILSAANPVLVSVLLGNACAGIVRALLRLPAGVDLHYRCGSADRVLQWWTYGCGYVQGGGGCGCRYHRIFQLAPLDGWTISWCTQPIPPPCGVAVLETPHMTTDDSRQLIGAMYIS